MATSSLSWSHGTASVSATAAMLTGAEFRLESGRRFSPFARASWAAGAASADLPGHLRELGGDFLALPFGSAAVPPDSDPDWLQVAAAENDPPHGVPADIAWSLELEADHRVRATLALPEPNDVALIERVIAGVPGQPALDFTTTVHARRPHRSPLGLHPIFRLPETGSARLDVHFESGLTYPGRVAGGSDLVLPGSRFDRLDDVPGRTGRLDLSHVPLPAPAEEVVQLLGARSPVRLSYPDGVGVALEWDDETLPSLLIWLSDRFLSESPWNGAYRGLGVEPIAAAFDLPAGTSLADNPIARAGHATAIPLDPSRPLVVRHRVAAFDMT